MSLSVVCVWTRREWEQDLYVYEGVKTIWSLVLLKKKKQKIF